MKKTDVIDVMQKIGRTIHSIASHEENILNKIAPNIGIYFMPELAFVYACGKAIMQDKDNIFGNLGVTWRREENVGSGGPTDLLFELENGKCIAIEFKLRDTSSSYLKDINKLSLLDPSKYICAFCALVDVFTDKLPYDNRINEVDTFPTAFSLLEPKPYFPTRQNWYSSNVSCVVCFWGIGDNFIE